MTDFLDTEALGSLDAQAFRAQKPYPWINPAELISADGYARLCRQLPEVSDFARHFGEPRQHGQTPHDRYALEYAKSLNLAPDWHAFVAELRGPEYTAFLRRMLGTRGFELRFHWHYTPAGCSVSPHCDNQSKLGSHIFYFNTEDEWDPRWGGETLVLDDDGRFNRASAPAFDDFDRITATQALGNRSLLFMRNGNSWHGVRELSCPPGYLRKVFIVVIEKRSLGLLAGRLLGRRAAAY